MGCVTINLNVGGQLFTTTKYTLSKYPSSLLGELCELKNHESSNYKVENDVIFFDRNSNYFGYILDFLRNEKFHETNYVLIKNIKEEACFFKLPKLIEICDEKIKTLREHKVVKLDVGGKKFETTMSILIENSSYFEKLFDINLNNVGQFNGCNSYIHIDRSGDYFEKILDFLKYGTQFDDINKTKPHHYYKQLKREAEFYKIQSLVNYCNEKVNIY